MAFDEIIRHDVVSLRNPKNTLCFSTFSVRAYNARLRAMEKVVIVNDDRSGSLILLITIGPANSVNPDSDK